MPIQFNQPEPVVPAIAQGYGAAQRFNEDRDFYLRQSQAMARANPPRPLPVLPSPGGGIAQSGPYFDPNAQAQAQATQLQSAYALQQDQLTQADRLRMAQLNQGLSELTRQHDAGILDDQAYNDGRLQIMAHLDPMQMRAAREQTALRQQQEQQLMHANAQRTAMQNMDGEQRAAYVQAHTVALDDGTRIYTGDPSGRPHVLSTRADHNAENREDRLRRDYLTHAQHIEDAVNRGDPDEPIPPDGADDAFWQRRQERNQRRRDTIDARLRQTFGATNLEDFLDNSLPGRAARRAGLRPGGGQFVGPPAPGGGRDSQQQAFDRLVGTLAAGRAAPAPEPPPAPITDDERRRFEELRARSGGHPGSMTRAEDEFYQDVVRRAARLRNPSPEPAPAASYTDYFTQR